MGTPQAHWAESTHKLPCRYFCSNACVTFRWRWGKHKQKLPLLPHLALIVFSDITLNGPTVFHPKIKFTHPKIQFFLLFFLDNFFKRPNPPEHQHLKALEYVALRLWDVHTYPDQFLSVPLLASVWKNNFFIWVGFSALFAFCHPGLLESPDKANRDGWGALRRERPGKKEQETGPSQQWLLGCGIIYHRKSAWLPRWVFLKAI